MAYGHSDIAAQYREILGRAPSPAEVDFLTKFLQEGSIQPHEIGQLLQASPEYQNTLLEKNTGALERRLGASDADILGKTGAAINSQFAGLGRPVSSGQVGALAQAGQSLAQGRQAALADFYGRGLQRNASLYEEGGRNALERGYGLRDETRQFGQQKTLAAIAKANYDNYLNQSNRNQRRRGIGAIAGGLLGAGLGGFAGAGAGSQIGAGIGGLF